ncbi:MAG: MFS transporter [Clostridia bacterium]|nr:MFS transporter [Clostridia bacterium]
MKDKQFKKFIPVWLGQFVSILGSGLSSFGLSVWIFYSTGAATPFALSFLCSMLPAVLFAPFAGSFADRRSRKKIIIVTDSLDALLKIVMVLLLTTGSLRLWTVYLILFLSSTLSTFQGPAFNASIPMMVGEGNIGRANGMLQFSQAAQNMIAPILAGALYPFIGLRGLIIIDFATFAVGIATIAMTAIPQERISGDGEQKRSMLGFAFGDSAEAFRFLKKKRALFSYIIVFAFMNFIANICMILIGPMVLGSYDSAIYGTVQTVYGVAMLLGGLVASVLPDRKNKAAMFGVLTLSGVGLVVAGWSPRWVPIAAGMFLFFLMVPYANTLLQTILHTSVEKTMLGRVGAMVNALLKIVSPIACIAAGPLADKVFEPLMQADGALGGGLAGRLLGVGAGRGSGMIFVICGVLLAAICLIMCVRASAKGVPAEIRQENAET